MAPDDGERLPDEFLKFGPEKNPVSDMKSNVFTAEILEICGSRKTRGLQSKADDLREKSAKNPDQGGPERIWNPSVDLGLVGLSLSGGGIRSSTFCLGVLQALNKAGLIRRVDYLSTVSGGGYIGAFWSCLLQKSRINIGASGEDDKGKYLASDPRFTKIGPLYELAHRIGEEESPVFQRLRNYANYLKPEGILSVIQFPALLLRGLFINFLMCLPYLLTAVIITAWAFKLPIMCDKYGSYFLLKELGFKFDLPASVYLFLSWLIVIIVLTSIQSYRRRLGLSGPKLRRNMLLANHYFLMIILLVGILDLQPKIIRHLDDLEDLTVPLTGVFGAITAFISAIGLTRTSDLASKFGLVLAAAAVPLLLVFLHLTLSARAVFGSQFLESYGLESVNLLRWYFYVGIFIFVISYLFFDVNATSLHNYYRDSLSNTFLFSLQRYAGEGNGKQNPETNTRLKEEDRITLAGLNISESGGPYHLINATVNNPDLGEMLLRGRRAELFVFGNRCAGNNRLGYCPTRLLERLDRSANLGTALAVSAAALSPNMGQKTQNPLIVFLLAMLNVRLGYWLPAPKRVNGPSAFLRISNRSHFVGPLYFIGEMLGWFRELRGRAINLSDAGHFENLGVLELLRRRCKYVIAIDGEADPHMRFNGLATVIRLARTDLGVEIDIDLDDLRKDVNGLSRSHWALGKIDYDDKQTGTLLYIKASVTGSENEYITEYRARNTDFPHESTGDQFFDEVRFEAYRALGYKVGASMFYASGGEASDSEFDSGESDDSSFKRFRDLGDVDRMFQDLSRRDTSTLPRTDTFFRLMDRRLAIEQKLAEPRMHRYAAEIFDIAGAAEATAHQEETDQASLEQEIEDHQDTPGETEATADQEKTDEAGPEHEIEVHQLVNQQLQLMEGALIGLKLHDHKNRAAKSNRGWMELFRGWSESETFRRHAAVSIDKYGSALKQFFEEEFNRDRK